MKPASSPQTSGRSRGEGSRNLARPPIWSFEIWSGVVVRNDARWVVSMSHFWSRLAAARISRTCSITISMNTGNLACVSRGFWVVQRTVGWSLAATVCSIRAQRHAHSRTMAPITACQMLTDRSVSQGSRQQSDPVVFSCDKAEIKTGRVSQGNHVVEAVK